MRALTICLALLWGAMAAAQSRDLDACDITCQTFSPWGGLAHQACRQSACLFEQSAGPAWTAGRMDDPDHGGFAAVASDNGADQFILTCESRGPISVVLRSGAVDRGLVQLRIDGTGAEWLTLEQRAGVLVAKVPRASRLVSGLRDGLALDIVAADGRIAARFGLRGSDRAIEAAMRYCSER